MDAFELPQDASVLDQAGAREELNALTASARGNPSHPLMNKSHPQHGDFLARVQRLYEVANPALESAESLSHSECAAVEARIKRISCIDGYANGDLRRTNRPAFDRLQKEMDGLYAKRWPEPAEVEDDAAPVPSDDEGGTVLRELCEAENAKLEAAGFQPMDLPDDPQPHDLVALKMHVASAAGDDRAFFALADSEMSRLGIDADPEMQNAVKGDLISRIHYTAQQQAAAADDE